jgi:signal peptidase
MHELAHPRLEARLRPVLDERRKPVKVRVVHLDVVAAQRIMYGKKLAHILMLGAWWLCLIAYTNVNTPLMVVASESMEPTYYKGDIIFVSNRDPIRLGDIMVFKLPDRDIPIVHRVVEQKGERYLTKGDNNPIDDRFLYKRWLTKQNIVGKVVASFPYIGHLSLFLHSHWWLSPLVIFVNVWWL